MDGQRFPEFRATVPDMARLIDAGPVADEALAKAMVKHLFPRQGGTSPDEPESDIRDEQEGGALICKADRFRLDHSGAIIWRSSQTMRTILIVGVVLLVTCSYGSSEASRQCRLRSGQRNG
jgi:hypothetical protein